MLDRTVVVYLSDGAESHHSRCFEWPFVILGTLAVDSARADVISSFPTMGPKDIEPSMPSITRCYYAVGMERDDFGHLDPNLDPAMHLGPLAQL